MASVILLLLIPGWVSKPVVGGEIVRCDVPAMIVAERVEPALVRQPSHGGTIVRLRFPVSTYVPAGFRGEIEAFTVELRSPTETLRIVDFWPRNQAYSNIVGTINVEKQRQQHSGVQFSGGVNMQPIATAEASGDYRTDTETRETYQKLPPVQALTSSGTLARGYGVFFKFLPGREPNLEGSRDVAVLAEVPPGWRADMIFVSISITGKRSQSAFQVSTIAESEMWMTVHREGDMAAAAQARRFVTQERALRALAASRAVQVRDKSMPTLLHKIGVALEVVPPRIPADYLTQVIFGPRDQYLEGGSHRLPIDVRVAILDFWETRDALVELALPGPQSLGEVVERGQPPQSSDSLAINSDAS